MSGRRQAEALFLESNRLATAGSAAEAEGLLREAVRLAPDFAEAYANLGLLLDRRGMADEAEACHRRSIALNPDYARTHMNLGVNLAQRKRFGEAEAAYLDAIRLDPALPAAWSNLGVLYACMKREAEAERCYRTASGIDPDYANARFNLAYILLRQGRYEEGWACMEARDWYAALEERLPCPRWRGEDLAGKTLIFAFEAGLGDMIQFCRYAPVLKTRGVASITMICHPPLKALFATLEGVDSVIGFNEPLPSSHYDHWTPPFSIPYYCKTRLDTIPAALPYLRSDPERVAHWQLLLPAQGPRVGLVWRGSRGFENDADRSLPSLRLLAPLWQVSGVSFVSLQKGAGEDAAAQPPDGQPLTDLGSQVEDLADTAAIISGLDLVIAVDTGVAHLAGALGKPCWVLLPDYKPDWRWLADRTDSPWYPGTMRLFRQKTMGEWGPVVDDVRGALQDFIVRLPNPA